MLRKIRCFAAAGVAVFSAALATAAQVEGSAGSPVVDEAAMAHQEAAFRLNPDENAWGRLEAAYLDAGAFARAAAFLNEEVQAGRSAPLDRLLLLARLHLAGEDFRGAGRYLAEARRLAPESPAVSDLFARLFASQGDSFAQAGEADRAALFWQRALEYDPDLAAAAVALGEHHRARQQWTEAREAFERLVARPPPRADYYLGLAEVLEHLEEPLRARAVLEQGVTVLRQAGPGAGIEALQEAMAQLPAPTAPASPAPPDLAGSLEELEAVVAADPGNETARRALAEGYALTGRFREALPLWLQLHQSFPENAHYFDQALTLALQEGDVVAAEPLLEQATARGLITETEKWLHLTKATIRAGEWEETVDALEAARRREPGHPGVRAQTAAYFAARGRAALEARRPSAALGFFENSLEAVNTDPEVLAATAELYLQLRRFDRVERLYRQMLRLAPENPGFYVRFAHLLVSRHKIEAVSAEIEDEIAALHEAGEDAWAVRLERGWRQLRHAIDVVRGG